LLRDYYDKSGGDDGETEDKGKITGEGKSVP
jgi:hypothetical protein